MTICCLAWPLALYALPPVKVLVSIMPQKYFVERIGAKRVRADVLVMPGKSPATYSPTPDQMRKLANADIYFRAGVPFENAVISRIRAVKGLKIVDTRTGIALRRMKPSGHIHSGISETADPTGCDPHVWMNPRFVRIQAKIMAEHLSLIDPDGRSYYQSNYERFAQDLEDLDMHLKAVLGRFKGKTLFVFHPAFGYFADAYGMKQVAVEAMGRAPKGRALSRIIKLARKQKVRVIFVQPQFDTNAALKIASAIHGAVVPIDPLAYQYLDNMKSMADIIAKALEH